MQEIFRNPNLKLCPYYVKSRKCSNPEKYECGEQLIYENEKICCSKLYYAMELEKEIERMKWYLNEIRQEELYQYDIDWNEYETERTCTEYTNIINLVEEALREKPDEECRYKED